MIDWLSALSRSMLLRPIGIFVPPGPPASAGWLLALLIVAVCLAIVFRATEGPPFRPLRDTMTVTVMSIAFGGMAFLAEGVYEVIYRGVQFP